jgi:hypothetical protein
MLCKKKIIRDVHHSLLRLINPEGVRGLVGLQAVKVDADNIIN